MNGTPKKVFRCAIYTRKSTEHNLDLEFNSLDAQREACEAYIKRRLATLLLFLVVSSGCAVLGPMTRAKSTGIDVLADGLDLPFI